MNKKSKILVTGSNGMIGKLLTKELQKNGFKKLTLVDQSKIDLRDRKKTISHFKKVRPEYIFHVASKVGGLKDNIERPVEFLRDNLLINTNVIDSAFACKAKKMITLNSATIYSNKINNPKEEDLLTKKIEEGNESYALSKICALKLCEYYNKEYNTEFISLALPNLYGEYSKFDELKSNVVAALIMKFHNAKIHNKNQVEVWGTGKAIREFMYGRDLAKLLIKSMTSLRKKDTINGLLNCGNGDEFSIKELAESIKEITGFNGKILFDKTKPEGAKKRSLNSNRFKKLISTKDKTLLENGIKNTYKYYLSLNR